MSIADTPAESSAATVFTGAWHSDGEITLTFPTWWSVRRFAPDDGPEIDDAAIERALAEPVGTPPLGDLARGKRTAAIAVDDLTRPTPAHRFLARLVNALQAAGVPAEGIRFIMGVAAHRPMTDDEIRQKLGGDLAKRFPAVIHDFMGPDIRKVGTVAGGPVYLNRHFLDADLKVVVGAVFPHAETGFGGGAKMVVPGLAGHLSIAHLHGALPPRGAGRLAPAPGALDRRAWAEAVARHVRVDLAVCAVVNSRRQLAGLHVGDVVEAHRAAARRARQIGHTPVPRDWAEGADVVVVSAYPLDTDPVQMGKALSAARQLAPRTIVAVNAASDGIHYHGMGMGSGINPKRLLRNLPGWLVSPRRWTAWARGLALALPNPELMARTCYFALNPLAYETFRRRAPQEDIPAADDGPPPALLVLSPNMPRWGLRHKYRHGRLYRQWDALKEDLVRRHGREARALVFPCAPLQLLEVVEPSGR